MGIGNGRIYLSTENINSNSSDSGSRRLFIYSGVSKLFERSSTAGFCRDRK
jgi:hypothetical protein